MSDACFTSVSKTFLPAWYRRAPKRQGIDKPLVDEVGFFLVHNKLPMSSILIVALIFQEGLRTGKLTLPAVARVTQSSILKGVRGALAAGNFSDTVIFTLASLAGQAVSFLFLLQHDERLRFDTGFDARL
jgi:hypothetical protein